MSKVIAAGLGVSVLLCGCGPACDPEEIDGTYRATTQQVSGDCGDMGTFVVQYDKGGQTTESGCVVDYDRLSEDQCTANRAVTCTNAADGLKTTGVGSVTQEPGGETASGSMTMTVKDLSSGSTVCTSTYDVTYTRQ